MCDAGASHCGGFSCCGAQAAVVAVHGLGWSTTGRISLDQGSNLCHLHWSWILNNWPTREAPTEFSILPKRSSFSIRGILDCWRVF